MKKTLTIIIAIILLGIIGYGAYYYLIEGRNYIPLKSGDLKLKLINGKSNKSIGGARLTICDFSVMFDLDPSQNNQSYCEMVKDIERESKVRITTATNREGIFYLNNSDLKASRGGDYIIEIDNPDYLASTITLQGPGTVRVLNEAKDGHVISNRYYDLSTKKVKEVFTDKSTPEKSYPYETIDLIVW